jgi:hypothetical protein
MNGRETWLAAVSAAALAAAATRFLTRRAEEWVAFEVVRDDFTIPSDGRTTVTMRNLTGGPYAILATVHAQDEATGEAARGAVLIECELRVEEDFDRAEEWMSGAFVGGVSRATLTTQLLAIPIAPGQAVLTCQQRGRHPVRVTQAKIIAIPLDRISVEVVES